MANTPAFWQAAAGSNSGNWNDPTHWTPSVPGVGTIAVLGASVTATVPWVVSVAGAQQAALLVLEMGSLGALAVGGTLDVGGSIEIGGDAIPDASSSLPGGSITVSAGGALTGAGNLVADLATIDINGGLISTAGFSDIDRSVATVQGGGAWNASEMFIGEFFTANVLLNEGALHIDGLLDLGLDPTMPGAAGPQGIGTLSVDGGSQVTALALQVVNASTLAVDSLSAVAVGGAATVAGALAIGNAGSVDLETVKIFAGLVDNGLLTVLKNTADTGLVPNVGPTVTGALSGAGVLHVGSGFTLEVGGAAGFAGGVTLDQTAELVVDAGAAPSGQIGMYHATIDMKGLTFGTGLTPSYNGATGVLTVGTDTFKVGFDLTATDFTATKDAVGGTLIAEVSCYAAGTRVAVEHGEVAVETLRPGDKVRTAGGRLAPVAWVGQMDLDLRRHPAPQHAAPVRIEAGAFAPGVPRRDLLLSPDHAVMLGGALIPARKLVNGATIRQDLAMPAVRYVHVELDRHDLLLAEGLPAESYLDTGNRGQFRGEPGARALHPRFDGDPEAEVLKIFAERGCAKLLLRGPEVAAAHARLLARAGALGWRPTREPALAIEGDRGGLLIVPDGQERLNVLVPAGTRSVHLQSRTFIPEMLDPGCGDGRRLGVALAVELDGTTLAETGFRRGWYPPDAGERWRWTDGDATLALPARRRRMTLTLHVVQAGARYWVPERAARAA